MLQVKKMSKSFGTHLVLDEISVGFNEGETTAILGASGSGKSTLLRCIDLLEIPEKGKLQIKNTQIDFPSKPSFSILKEFRRHFSIVFQSYNLFPHFTVLQNIIEGPVQVKGEKKSKAINNAINLLKRIGLNEKQDSFPSQLSGGQQQRVAIVRALAMEPDFILYDEPTSALDPELSNEVLLTIQQLAENGNSQIVVTHNLEFAKKVADRILFLEEGKIIFDGPTNVFFGKTDIRIQRFIRKIS